MYYDQPFQTVLSELDSTIEGLSQEEALQRLEKIGYNELPHKEKLSALTLFLHQFQNPLIYILVIAGVISLFFSHLVDALIITVVILISSVVGFLQEYKAGQALAHIKKMIQHHAKVLRDQKEVVIAQKLLVPGDIILLTAGDRVPADARLIETRNFETIEAALTGESLPSVKQSDALAKETVLGDRSNMVFMGTIVARGSAKAVVTATGKAAKMGQIAELVQTTEEEKSPLQKQVMHFGKVIGIILIILNLIIFLLGFIAGRPFFEMFLTSVSMIVAAVPEGLLPAMMVILAIGMERIAKHKGLVRKMYAAEGLGSISVICSDKTGTLTQGEMRVAEIITETQTVSHQGVDFSHRINLSESASHVIALKIALLCNNAIIKNPEDELRDWEVVGDPTEKALLLAGRAAGFKKEILEQEEPRVAEIPFESAYQYMATLHQFEQQGVIYLKGSPEKILSFCNRLDIDGTLQALNDAKRREIRSQYEALTRKGLRVLAVAYRELSTHEMKGGLKREALPSSVFIGLIGIKDPLRPAAKETIAQCRSAGIRPVIITGDHRLTAMAIVNDLGVVVTEEQVLEGKDLEAMSDELLKKRVEEVIIFARVEPQHKIRIVRALQENGEIVAMTGDGVNDAPALKKSDIGVAVGSGTDVAKETADLVLTDDSFKTIIEAIRRGRGIFDNIRKVVVYLMANSFTEVILIGATIILGLPLPLLPAQILWIKMIEDSAPSMALAFDAVDKNVMKRPPRPSSEPILNSDLKKLMGLFAITADLSLFGIFYYFWKTSGDINYARTIAFVGLGIASRFYIFSIRGITQSILSYNPFKNQWVNLSTLFGFAMIAVAIYVPFFNRILHTVPLGLTAWSVLIGFAFFTVVIYEIGKKLMVA